MLSLIYCPDGEGAPAVREARFDVHARHIMSVLGQLCLAAPLAREPGVSAHDYSRLCASIFATDKPTVRQARELIESDPYFTGGAWTVAQGYSMCEIQGSWLSGGYAPREPLLPRFVAFYRGAPVSQLPADIADEHRTYVARLADRIELHASLEPESESPAGSWCAVYVCIAESAAEFDSLVRGDPCVSREHWRSGELLCAPAAIGSWIDGS